MAGEKRSDHLIDLPDGSLTGRHGEGEITAKLRELEDAFDRWWATLDRVRRAAVATPKELLDQFGRAWRSRREPEGTPPKVG